MKQPALHRRSAPRKGVEWVLPQSHAANSLSFMKFVSQVFHLHLKSEEMESDPKLETRENSNNRFASETGTGFGASPETHEPRAENRHSRSGGYLRPNGPPCMESPLHLRLKPWSTQESITQSSQASPAAAAHQGRLQKPANLG